VNTRGVVCGRTVCVEGAVATLGKQNSDVPLPENESTPADHVIELRRNLQPDQVREGQF
jgi:hypothetical protein